MADPVPSVRRDPRSLPRPNSDDWSTYCGRHTPYIWRFKHPVITVTHRWTLEKASFIGSLLFSANTAEGPFYLWTFPDHFVEADYELLVERLKSGAPVSVNVFIYSENEWVIAPPPPEKRL